MRNDDEKKHTQRVKTVFSNESFFLFSFSFLPLDSSLNANGIERITSRHFNEHGHYKFTVNTNISKSFVWTSHNNCC